MMYKASVEYHKAIGCLVWLSMHSSLYRTWTIAAIEDNYLPALELGQCRIYFSNDGNPRAFVTWAFLGDEAHTLLQLDGITPAPDQWNSGTNLWFMDIVAPFGDVLRVIRDLQRNHFPNQNAYSIKRSPDGSIARVKRWRNALGKKNEYVRV